MQQSSEWRHMNEIPKGRLCVLLTEGGIPVIGYAPYNGQGYVAWLPLPPAPPPPDWVQ
jgi:hypothetical protein